MKREHIFNRGGFYGFCVQSNALMHREAAIYGTKILASVLAYYPDDQVIDVLDLACGSMPIALVDMLAQFPNKRFSYTGIDINPDQIHSLRADFEFPDNVIEVNAFVASAWELPKDQLKPSYDIIFEGFNLHHGTPEEIHYLAQQLYVILNDQGVFLNCDFYRPDNTVYVRRPDTNPDNPAESFLMVDAERLAAIQPLELVIDEAKYEPCPAWKEDFITTLEVLMTSRGGDPTNIKIVRDHVSQRDYPVSANEAVAIFKQAGFAAEIVRYQNTSEPTEKFYALAVATKSAQLIA